MPLKQLGKKVILEWKNEQQPELLECFYNKHPDNLYLIPFIQERDEFSSLCPVTGAPDHAAMEIIYVPSDRCVESKSLKLYLMSFRQTGAFHEDVCNTIANDLFKLLEPNYIRVYGNFAPRGSLAIKPLVEKWKWPEDEPGYEKICNLVRVWDSKK